VPIFEEPAGRQVWRAALPREGRQALKRYASYLAASELRPYLKGLTSAKIRRSR
jgi:hypothetical protein